MAHDTWKNLVPLQYRLDFFTSNYQVWFQRNMKSDALFEGGIVWRVFFGLLLAFTFGYGGTRRNLI
jgi:hypothetical protein